MKQFGNPPFLRVPPPLSTNPPISEQYFHDPPPCPMRTPPPPLPLILRREETMIAYGDFKDLAKRTASEKVLRDKAFNIAKNPKSDGYQRVVASVVYKFFNKKSRSSGINNETK